MALARRNFYDKVIHPHKDSSSVNAIFFRDIAPKNTMARNSLIVNTHQEANFHDKKEGHEKYSFITVEKHPVHFCLNINHPLMMFLWLIPVAMVYQRPTYLFDFGDSG